MRSLFITWLFIGFSSIVRVVSGAVEPDPAHGVSRVAWRQVTEGLSFAEGSFFCDRRESPVQYEAIKVDLGRQRIAVLDARNMGEKTMRVRAFVERTDAEAAINGGFFLEGFVPLGLIISGGVKKNDLRKADWGVFYIRRGKPGLIHTREYVPDAAITEAIQAGPRLVIGGRVPALKEQISRRSALGITRTGEVILLTTKSSVSYADSLARFLARRAQDGGMDCVDALNLDGGPSTQFYADLPGLEIDTPGGYGVPNCIAVFSRSPRREPARAPVPQLAEGGGHLGTARQEPPAPVPIYSPEDVELLKKADALPDDGLAGMSMKGMGLQRRQLIETGKSFLSKLRQVPVGSGKEGFLYTDLRGPAPKRAAEEIETFDDFFRALVKRLVPGNFDREPAALFVFSREAAYRRFAEAVSPGLSRTPGFYHAATRIAALSAEGVDPRELDYGILHEYAHHLFCQATMASTGKTPPYWLDEGMALLAASTFPGRAGTLGENGDRESRLDENGARIFLNRWGVAKWKALDDETRRGAGLSLGALLGDTPPGEDDEKGRKRFTRTAGFFLLFLLESEVSLREDLRAYIASGFSTDAFLVRAGDPQIQKKWERYILSLETSAHGKT
jgi:uncharacterized protein YigE (DUF2233 family)